MTLAYVRKRLIILARGRSVSDPMSPHASDFGGDTMSPITSPPATPSNAHDGGEHQQQQQQPPTESHHRSGSLQNALRRRTMSSSTRSQKEESAASSFNEEEHEVHPHYFYLHVPCARFRAPNNHRGNNVRALRLDFFHVLSLYNHLQPCRMNL
jgi:hypothetical protein